MDLSKLTHGFLWVVTCFFSKLLHGFVKVVKWIWQNCIAELSPNHTTSGGVLFSAGVLYCSIYFSPLARQNQADAWPRFQYLVNLLPWTTAVEWVKALLGPVVPVPMFFIYLRIMSSSCENNWSFRYPQKTCFYSFMFLVRIINNSGILGNMFLFFCVSRENNWYAAVEILGERKWLPVLQ